jgi:hypothetical protein
MNRHERLGDLIQRRGIDASGLSGYTSRELIATPHTGQPIEPGQAFAWNPSVTGANAEETFVLTESGPEVVADAAPPVV